MPPPSSRDRALALVFASLIATLAIASIAAPALSERRAGDPFHARSVGRSTFEGVVVTRLPAGPYTYLEIDRGDGHAWAAVLGEGEVVGTRVSVRSLGHADAMRSPRLGRVFDRVHFALVRPLPPGDPR